MVLLENSMIREIKKEPVEAGVAREEVGTR